MLDLDEFVARFSGSFNRDEVPLSADTGLYDEVGLDSFDAFLLLLFLESLAGVGPDDNPPPLYTVGDCYDYYRAMRASAEDGFGAPADGAGHGGSQSRETAPEHQLDSTDPGETATPRSEEVGT